MTISSPDLTRQEASQGLTCPNCGGVVPIAEGLRVVQCPYCSLHSLIQGDRGVLRWQVERTVDRSAAEATMRDFLGGVRKARDLRKSAEVSELLLVYLPFWRVEATVAGWLFGRVRKDKDETKPDESYIFEPMEWNDAALDVSEYGVHRIVVDRSALKPFDSQRLHAEAMVFEPSESRTAALDEAEKRFRVRTRQESGQSKTFSQKIEFLEPQFALVYYPIWIGRYNYRNRTYQVAVDGVTGDVMYGRAPGSSLYRAAALVVGLAAGNLVLINGTILAGSLIDDEDGLGLLLLPVLFGLGLILYGYRSFRFGEEVEDKPREHQKEGVGIDLLSTMIVVSDLPSLIKTGRKELEAVARQSGIELPFPLAEEGDDQ